MKDYSDIIDISLTIHPNMMVYPGNDKVTFESFASSSGQTYLSKIIFGSHTGTHIDAPRHVDKNGIGASEVELDRVLGKCRVLDFTRSSESISAADIVSKSIVKGERILAKTKNSQRGFDTFYKDYVYLSPEAAESLAELDIKLFGIDSLSVKQSGGSNIPHTALLNRGIVIFEGLDLSRVDEGRYFLAALPLKLKGLDGAPARVVLLK